MSIFLYRHCDIVTQYNTLSDTTNQTLMQTYNNIFKIKRFFGYLFFGIFWLLANLYPTKWRLLNTGQGAGNREKRFL